MPEKISPNPAMPSRPNKLLAPLRSVPRNFWFGAAAVCALFSSALIELVAFSLSGSLYSHIILIPAVSVYLVITHQIPRKGKGEGASLGSRPVDVRLLDDTPGQGGQRTVDGGASRGEPSGAREDRRWQMGDRADSEVGLEDDPPSLKASAGRRATATASGSESASRRHLLGRDRTARRGAALIALGVLAIVAYWVSSGRLLGAEASQESRLAWQVGAFLFAFWGVCLVTLPRSTMKGLLFPLGFLVFMMPFPPAVLRGIETLLQHGSADVSYGLLRLAGTPVFREGLLLQLPGINLEVAPQCSGIRSSLVLFITSTIAAYMFLRTNWKRAVLIAFILPLAMLRNGFRIFVIGELCVRYGPEMIDSVIHHRGGPIFFALSLVPLFLLLWILWRSERKRRVAHTRFA